MEINNNNKNGLYLAGNNSNIQMPSLQDLSNNNHQQMPMIDLGANNYHHLNSNNQINHLDMNQNNFGYGNPHQTTLPIGSMNNKEKEMRFVDSTKDENDSQLDSEEDDTEVQSERKTTKINNGRTGRKKIPIEFIKDKNKRNITFSKRKYGIMKKAFELSKLTGTQILLLIVSETGLVYTFTTLKLQPIVTKTEGRNLIQACLNSNTEETNDNNTAKNDTSPSPNKKGRKTIKKEKQTNNNSTNTKSTKTTQDTSGTHNKQENQQQPDIFRQYNNSSNIMEFGQSHQHTFDQQSFNDRIRSNNAPLLPQQNTKNNIIDLNTSQQYWNAIPQQTNTEINNQRTMTPHNIMSTTNNASQAQERQRQ